MISLGVVVLWDQRGSGKSYSKDLIQFLVDGLEKEDNHENSYHSLCPGIGI